LIDSNQSGGTGAPEGPNSVERHLVDSIRRRLSRGCGGDA
jgi:hypothetical protein